jgi:hypothetical protein
MSSVAPMCLIYRQGHTLSSVALMYLIYRQGHPLSSVALMCFIYRQGHPLSFLRFLILKMSLVYKLFRRINHIDISLSFKCQLLRILLAMNGILKYMKYYNILHYNMHYILNSTKEVMG